MRFWLDLGVDGLRLDAIPYLVERDGTNNENLPETHRRPEADPRRARPGIPRPDAAGRGEPVAGGHPRVFRRRRRMPHGVPLSADAADVHGGRPGGSAPDRRHPAADPGDPRELPVGDLPAQPRRADAGDGDRQGARLSLERLRLRLAGPHQPRHPAPAGAAAAERPAQDRADERHAAVDAGHAGHLLRRRARHGRQHLPRRPRRRAHPDAVVARPQRRVLPRRSPETVPARDHGSDLRLSGRQRGKPAGRPVVAAELVAPACWPCATSTRRSAAAT